MTSAWCALLLPPILGGARLAGIVRFGDCEVDPAAGQLFKRGKRVRLPDQAFRVLAAFIERPGEVVTREELRRRLWPDEVLVDFENLLNTAVARLRAALGDPADHPPLIETLPKRGYRFIGTVSEPVPPSNRAPTRRPRLLVLRFLNTSGDPAHEYFSDAMTDELITALAALAPLELAVIARTTAFHYKGTPTDIARIARQLGVDCGVQGGARRTAERAALIVN